MRSFTLRLPVKWYWLKARVVVMTTALFFVANVITYAQTNIANYTFATTTGNTYTPITGGTTVFSSTYDNSVSAAIPLGGTFTFGGANFTTCFISTNGFITFGVAPSSSSYTPISTLGTTTGAISAFGQDAGGSTVTGATPLISYVNTGTEFVVQYADHANYFNRTVERLNFQIRLTLATGVINIIYGTCTNPGTSTSGSSVQVGIRGNTVTWADNISSLLAGNVPTATTCDWSNAVSSNANSSALLFSSTTNVNVKIPAGLQYSWTPGTLAPVRTFAAVSGITSSDATISCTAPTGATQYNVRYRVPGTCTWTSFSGNPVAGTTATLTGLTSATSYQVQVQAGNGTSNSIWSHIPTSAAGAGLNGYTTTGTFTTLANACSGTPTPGSSAVSVYNLCQNSTQVLTVTGASTPATSTGITNQWDSSANGVSGWVPVMAGSGATTTTYTIAPFGGTTVYYRMRTTCTNSGLSANTPVITINGPAAPTTQSSAVTAGTPGLTTATLSWTVGSGNNRTVYINSTNSFVDPVSPSTPGTAATAWANAGQQLVYDGTASSVSITGLSASTIYYVRVYEGQKCTTPSAAWYYNVSTATNNPGTFTTASPPANDECANAVTVGVNTGTTCTTVVSGTLVGASASTGPASTCGTYDDDVWYKFVPSSDIQIITLQNLAGSTSDLTFQVLDACGATTALLCSDPQSATISGLTVGSTYYLRVASWTSTVGQTSTFDVCITTPPAMTYTSSAVTQSSTASVVAGTINQQVLRIAITVSGATTPLSLTQFDFNTSGTTNAADIDSAKVFFTGTSSSFATTTRFGTGIADPNGAFSITGSQALTGSATTAVNYFWLVYDIDCASTAANLVDAECTSINVGGPQTPTTPAPTGTRAITAPTYTAVTSQSSTAAVFQGATNAQILRVTLTGCANTPVTEINFSTTGSTNAGSDIAAARVYYTTTTTFATTTQFGSDVASPNGAFTVSGSQPLTTGTGYFWLVYDITAGATASNVIDASCVNATTNSVVATPTTPNPTGTRTILAPITNDEASGATALTVNSDLACGTVTSGTTVSATQSADAAPTCSATGIDDDVWYTFVATGASHRISYSSVSTGTMVAALYTGAPGALSLVAGACASTTLDATGLVSGTTYYVRSFNTATTSATQSSFNICVGTPPPPPANDACANAANLTVSNGFCATPVLGTLISADSTTGLGVASCEALALKFDVWYKVTVPATGKVTVQTSAVNTTVTDLVMQAYSGSCGSLTAIGCDDDGNPDASPSSAHAKLGLTGRTPGEVIFFRVMPYNSSTNIGAFAICAFDTTASVTPLVASGTPNGCITAAAPVNVDSAYKYTWVSFKDASGNLIAQIYPNGNILGSTSASIYLNSGAVRQDSKGIYYLDRNVTIIPAQQPTTAVTTRLYLTNAELSALATVVGATTRSQLNISKTSQDCAGSAVAADGVYIAQSTSAAYGTEHTIDFSNTAFSTFYLHKGTIALPITLVYFNGAKTNAGNLLNWKVNCTSVSVGFEIERSANGRNFSSIGILNATQARCLTPFDFADSKPLAGVNYYRIKIIDVDGKVSYTNIVAINNKKSGIELVGIQPTLVNSEAVLYIAAAKAGKLQIAVTDNVGRHIQTRTITVIEGDNKVSLNFGNLAAGVYNLSSINESTKSTIRFVKQ